MGPAPVTPDEIPGLQERAVREPGNGAVHLRLGAALLSANRCEEAVASAERGRALLPADPIGPLIVGQCLEQAQRFDEALDLYSSFVEANRNAHGVSAVEGRRVIALKLQARQMARSAIANQETLGPVDPERVGVLPFLVDGDTMYAPLRVGLANMLTTDLALLQRFPMVERVRLEAILEELRLPADLVDRSTAARAGRLLQASRMVLGTISIPSEDAARLSSNIVLETGETVEPLSMVGNLEDLLNLEKELAVQTAEALGYQLTEAEVQRIRQNAPGNMTAFLLFSRGLMAEDAGDYEAAAAYYGEAVQADPGYEEAQGRLNGAVGAEVLTEAGEGELTSVSTEVEEGIAEATGTSTDLGSLASSGVLSTTLASSIFDVASHQAERATEHVGTGTPTEVVIEQPHLPPLLMAFILITIVIPR